MGGSRSSCVVHVDTNDMRKAKKEVLLWEYEQLGTKLKRRTKKVIIYGMLPEPRVNWHRINEIR